MRRVYMVLASVLIAGWAWAEWTGWEPASEARRGVVPATARNTGGFRSYHFWSGGK